MGQSLHQVYGHIVFSTKERRPLIPANIEKELHSYLSGIARELGATVISINGMPDHIHLIVRASKSIPDSEFIQQLKGSSSKWMNAATSKPFHWQSGYGWFSVSAKDLTSAVQYVERQKEHHKRLSFKEELIKFLDTYGVTYDEKYLWD